MPAIRPLWDKTLQAQQAYNSFLPNDIPFNTAQFPRINGFNQGDLFKINAVMNGTSPKQKNWDPDAALNQQRLLKQQQAIAQAKSTIKNDLGSISNNSMPTPNNQFIGNGEPQEASPIVPGAIGVNVNNSHQDLVNKNAYLRKQVADAMDSVYGIDTSKQSDRYTPEQPATYDIPEIQVPDIKIPDYTPQIDFTGPDLNAPKTTPFSGGSGGSGGKGAQDPSTYKYLGAIAGVGQTLLNNAMGGDSMKRLQEKEVREALDLNVADRERINAQDPEANRRAAAMQIRQGESTVKALASQGAGAAAGNGLGGDVSSDAIAGADIALASSGAAQQQAQALGSLQAQKAGEEFTINNQLQQNTMQRAQIGDMVNYVNKQKANPFFGLINGAVGGANQFASFFRNGTVDSQKV